MPHTQQNLAELQSEEHMLIQILTAKSLLPAAGAKVLDIGCGAGDLTGKLLGRGFDAYGTDLEPNWETGDSRNSTPTLTQDLQDRLRVLTLEPYRLPFEDASFDLCVSIQVLEHVQDYPAFMRELQRVLIPGGASLHLFPSRWRYLESHIEVPFAGVFQDRTYLALWAKAGIRNRYQQDQQWDTVVEDNLEFLHRFTAYYTTEQITEMVSDSGLRPEFVSREYTQFHRSPWVRFLSRLPFPGLSALYCKLTQLTLVINKA
jgi:ubiquinone/menaquinone biosynthesis C-methylase UbiE